MSTAAASSSHSNPKPSCNPILKMLSKTLLFALFALATTTSAQADDDQSSNCVQGVFVVAARGSDPNWHDPTKTDPAYKDIDGLRDIGQSVINDVGKGSHLQALPYPASLDNYPVSVGNGIDAARKIIHNYVDNCSKKVDPKIVLLGYSQGAQVMSDTLVGGQGRGMLEDKYAKHSELPCNSKRDALALNRFPSRCRRTVCGSQLR